MSKYVIIGNSAAAIGAVEAIRKNDTEGGITIISSEAYETYSRPLISYLFLNKTTEEKMKYRPSGFYKDNKCEFLPSKTAVSIKPDKKTVILAGGEEIAYEKLLVAAGSSPFVPPMTGLDAVGNKFTFMSLDDQKALEKALDKHTKVLIVGAGLIGLKCAEGIKNRVASVEVVDLAPRVLSSILDEEGAKIIQKHMENNGIKFRLADSVKEFKSNSALLASGESIDFDVLVIAVGVRPNTGLVKEAGGEVRRGIVIDSFCQTTLPDVYAAGDCVEATDASTGESKILALLPNAYIEGECAGNNMSGKKCGYKVIPMNAIGFFGKHILSAGSYSGEVYSYIEGDNYKKLFYSDNKLNGFILIGNVDKAGIYTALVREKTPLDKLDFALIAEKPGLMAFTKEERAHKLGGKPI